MKQYLLFICFSFWFSFFLIPLAKADEIRLAVAANFIGPMKQLIEQFQQTSPHRVSASYASSGKLYAQIKQGAPFDLFFSADSATPLRLISEGRALADSRITYAIGQLVLWSATGGYVDAQGKILSSGQFRHLALAQPKLAPYGLAAQQVLEKLKLWDKLQPRLVFGESVSQTHQFVASGNAELGFLPLSSVIRQPQDSYWRVPADLYSPIQQQMVLLKPHARASDATDATAATAATTTKAAALAFWQFIQTQPAQNIIQAAGYRLPPNLPASLSR
jgi:molybdate transport system substrate-binding protein